MISRILAGHNIQEALQQDDKINFERPREISRPMNADAVRKRFKDGTWDNADVKWVSENLSAVLQATFQRLRGR